MAKPAQTPEFRFPGFTEPWMEKSLEDLCKVQRGERVVRSQLSLSGVPVYQNSLTPLGYFDAHNRPANSTFLIGAGAAGEIGFSTEPFWAADDCYTFKPIKPLDQQFLHYTLLVHIGEIKGNIHRASIPRLSVQDVAVLGINAPTLSEQEKIGGFFAKLDEDLTHQETRLKDLKKVKAACLKKFFPQEGASEPEFRFPGFTEPWKKVKLGEVAMQVTRKNAQGETSRPLTISAQFGLVDQQEFFNSRVASRDLSGYYVIRKGEFAYNRSTSDGAPVGAIRRLDRYPSGALSTVYTVFAIDEIQTVSDYLAAFLAAPFWHTEVLRCAAVGARAHGMLNVSNEDFFNICVPLPSLAEQEEIGMFFARLDELISVQAAKVERLGRVKSALLKKFFV